MIQRRKFARVDMHYPIFCIFTDNDLGKNIKTSGHVHDLSMGGMKIEVSIPPNLYNSRALLYSLELPEPFNTVTGHGKIIWIDKNENTKSMLFGVKFTYLSREAHHDLKTIIHELVEN